MSCLMPLHTSRLGPWEPLVAPRLVSVEAALAAETRPVLPDAAHVFAALEMVPPDAARVVILGQDPYPTPGHAHGLAFSAEPHVRPLPRSLANIYREMEADICAAPDTADLRGWARQGVLLLNSVLTVPAGEAGGHAKIGWQEVTGAVLDRLDDHPRALMLWGKPAQKLAAKHLRHEGHLRIETAHPSPLSARKGFFGSRPFSRVNEWFEARGEAAVAWV